MATILNRTQTFATNGTVTAAGLHNLIDDTGIYAGLITTQTELTTVGTADQLLIAVGGVSDTGAPRRATVQNLFDDALSAGTYTGLSLTGALTYGTATGNRTVSTSATITTGTIPNLTAGTTTSTAATITTGTIPTLTAGTTTGTAGIFTSGTIATLNSTTGTIATLNSTTGTITTLNSTTGTIATGVIPTLTSTTLITTGPGTAAAPAIVPTGDTNTGVFFPDADRIAFSTGGAEAMRINSIGDVGIGTNSPSQKLDIQSASASVQIKSTTATNSAILKIENNSTAYIGNETSSANSLFLGTTAYATCLGNVGAYPVQLATNNNVRMTIDSSGSLILAGSTAQKASGTTWSNPSDIRIKKNIRDYEKGLDSLMQVRVREWEYNGKAGTVADTKSMGVVADEVQKILPDTVSTYKAKLNPQDEEDSDIKKFDATEITWLLVKAVQELSAKVTALEAA